MRGRPVENRWIGLRMSDPPTRPRAARARPGRRRPTGRCAMLRGAATRRCATAIARRRGRRRLRHRRARRARILARGLVGAAAPHPEPTMTRARNERAIHVRLWRRHHEEHSHSWLVGGNVRSPRRRRRTRKRSPSATTASPPTACRSASRLHKGYFKEEGLNVTGLITSAGGGTSLRNMLAGGGVPYGEVNPGRRRVGDPRRRRPEDHQRQRAHRRRVRVGGEAGLADQVDQGLQGQEDRLHQSALDEPGARADAAAGRAATPKPTPSS